MSEQGKAQIQTLGAGLIGFLGVVAVGAFLVLPHGGGAKASSSSVSFAAKIPPNLSAPAPSVRSSAGAPAGQAAGSSVSPVPLMPTERPEAKTAAAEQAAAAAAASSAAPRLAPTAHLDVSGSAHSSASASVASAASAKAAPRPARKPFAAPKLDLSKSIGVASTVHYGVSSRADIMGRAAGPVYNFSGKSLKAPSSGSSISGQAQSASDQIDQSRQQIDASQLSDGDKAKIDSTLDQAQKGVKQAGQQ